MDVVRGGAQGLAVQVEGLKAVHEDGKGKAHGHADDKAQGGLGQGPQQVLAEQRQVSHQGGHHLRGAGQHEVGHQAGRAGTLPDGKDAQDGADGRDDPLCGPGDAHALLSYAAEPADLGANSGSPSWYLATLCSVVMTSPSGLKLILA